MHNVCMGSLNQKKKALALSNKGTKPELLDDLDSVAANEAVEAIKPDTIVDAHSITGKNIPLRRCEKLFNSIKNLT